MKTRRLAYRLELKDLILVPLALTLLIAFCGCRKEKKETAEVPEINVAYPVQDSVVLHKIYPGYIRSVSSADVMALVNGRILSVNYKEGSYVSKGQVLFTIESTKYRDAVNQASAGLSTARAQYDYSSRQYEAMKKAIESDAVSEMELLQAKSSMESAEASIRNYEAALRTARTNLGYCTVTAPVSGLITAPVVTAGNYVAGEAQPVKLASIYDDRQMKAVFDIEEAQYRLMSVNTAEGKGPLYTAVPLRFTPDLPVAFTADLYYTSPAVDAATGTLTLEGTVTNKDKLLKDGMYVTVDLPYGVEPHAVLVRDASIGRDQRGSYLYVINDSDKVVYTPVQTGELFRDTLRIINSGIKPGDRYVTQALLTVRNGEKVRPVVQGATKQSKMRAK